VVLAPSVYADDRNAAAGYPRPQFVRKDWICLDGPWDFAVDHDARWGNPEQVRWNAKIIVPYAPETEASGIGDTGYYRTVWYRRTFAAPELRHGERLLLHFGAVDTAATVWVNGHGATAHIGGYTPFKVDITDLLAADREQVIVVQADDDPADLTKPRGKQDWQLEPHSIWYPRTTGIWQTVWMECVPATWLEHIRWTPSLPNWEIQLDARLEGLRRNDLRLRTRLECEGQTISDDTFSVASSEVNRGITFSDPGIDDYRNELLWRPSRPTLIDAYLELQDASGNVIDSIKSYTALRSVGTQGDRFVLNGRPFPLRMILDQGYWLGSGLTPPDDEAVRRDVELAKAMGFNGVRRHQKISSPRYLYWADRLGLLVWEEMPSAYRFTKRSIKQVCREWAEAVERDLSHPCIISWVPLNESWGVPDLPDSPTQRHYVQALYHLTKTLDPTRPVIGNDGWESVATDIIGIHDYDEQPERLVSRYGTEERSILQIAERERPGGRMLVVDASTHQVSKPIMLTEFGGIAYAKTDDGETWGYSRARSPEDLAERYASLMSAMRSLPIFSGFCYTQFADTYQEANGLLYFDRTPKFPLTEIAVATTGPRRTRQRQLESRWRERLMQTQMNLESTD
jgi:beta-galactosidase/beta-glucuronidase